MFSNQFHFLRAVFLFFFTRKQISKNKWAQIWEQLCLCVQLQDLKPCHALINSGLCLIHTSGSGDSLQLIIEMPLVSFKYQYFYMQCWNMEMMLISFRDTSVEKVSGTTIKVCMLWSGEVSDRSVYFDRFTSGRTRAGGGAGWGGGGSPQKAIMIYGPANSNWLWLAKIGMGREWPGAPNKDEVDSDRLVPSSPWQQHSAIIGVAGTFD